MTFTVGFQDLETDFKALSKKNPMYLECLDPDSKLTFSNLDLKAWLDRRAFYRLLSVRTVIRFCG